MFLKCEIMIDMLRKKFYCLILIFSLGLVGCSTNRMGDPKKTKYIKTLSSQGEEIMGQIDKVLSEKELEAISLKQKLLDLQSRIKKEYGEQNVRMKKIEKGWKVSILDQILFDSGSHNVNPVGKSLLCKVAVVLKSSKKNIQVSGYTDSQPVKRSKRKYKNNWDLSMKRALSVLNFFEEKGVPSKKMVAVGFGQYRPLLKDTSQKALRKNRRVEILIFEDLERVDWKKR
ncbi:hypothetical protein AB834_04110 [PVC group bacterium (ex Bugula neritina AB1)]|nr:hypothetical protein AB834_04110 [PVC group bacterium (ex Bugula neritina AB1)]